MCSPTRVQMPIWWHFPRFSRKGRNLRFWLNVGSKIRSTLSREVWNQLRARLQSQRLLALDYYSGGI